MLFSTCIDAAQRRALTRTVVRLGGGVAPDGDKDFTHFVTVRPVLVLLQGSATVPSSSVMRQAMSTAQLEMPGCLRRMLRDSVLCTSHLAHVQRLASLSPASIITLGTCMLTTLPLLDAAATSRGRRQGARLREEQEHAHRACRR